MAIGLAETMNPWRRCQNIGWGLLKMMAVMATDEEASGLTDSERKTETVLLQLRDLACRPLPAVVEAAGQSHKPTMWSLHLGGVIEEDADFMIEVWP